VDSLVACAGMRLGQQSEVCRSDHRFSWRDAYKALEPHPPYADAVVRCLIEKGMM